MHAVNTKVVRCFQALNEALFNIIFLDREDEKPNTTKKGKRNKTDMWQKHSGLLQGI